MVTVNKRMLLRSDTEANWSSSNPVLADGEIGFSTNTKTARPGDGVSAFNSLGIDLVPEVSSFPTAETGARVFHTGHGMEFFYSGTQWRSTKIFHRGFTHDTMGSAYSATIANTYTPVPWLGQFSLWMESVDFTTFHNTNGISWNHMVSWSTAANVSTEIALITTTHNINIWLHTNVVIGSQLNATAVTLVHYVSENSGAGGIYVGASLNYRLIGA